MRAARILIGMEQLDLAAKASVSIGTIRRMESYDGQINCNSSTLRKVQKALEKAGVEFLDDGRPGVRLKI